jgi:hypothetical protein
MGRVKSDKHRSMEIAFRPQPQYLAYHISLAKD